MKLLDYLSKNAVSANLKAHDKSSAIRELVRLMKPESNNLDRESVVRAILERERLGSTGIGKGVAIPHGKIKDAKQLVSAFGKIPNGIDFDSEDGEPVRFLYLLISPYNSVGLHLQVLAKISRLFRNPDLIDKLDCATTADEIYAALSEADNTVLSKTCE